MSYKIRKVFDIGTWLKDGSFIPALIENENGSFSFDPKDTKIMKDMYDNMSDAEKHSWDMIEQDQCERTENMMNDD